jgi:hypothetical protein
LAQRSKEPYTEDYMTRTRVLSGILIGLFVIMAIMVTLFLTSGLAGDKAHVSAPSPSNYFLETKNSP